MYVHKVWYIIKEWRPYSNTTSNKYSEHLSRKNIRSRRLRLTSKVGKIKNESLRVTALIIKVCSDQPTKTQKWMCCVSNNKNMLKHKTNTWKLLCLTWSIVIYHDNNSNPNQYWNTFVLMRTLYTTFFTTMPCLHWWNPN